MSTLKIKKEALYFFLLLFLSVYYRCFKSLLFSLLDWNFDVVTLVVCQRNRHKVRFFVGTTYMLYVYAYCMHILYMYIV